MQPLTVDFICSLDGYGAAEGWPGWWGMESPEYLQWLEESPEQDHPILMGARTYRLMSELAASGEPGTDVLADMPKVVFSSTLTEPLACARSGGSSGCANISERQPRDARVSATVGSFRSASAVERARPVSPGRASPS